jgi:hypothetical protein
LCSSQQNNFVEVLVMSRSIVVDTLFGSALIAGVVFLAVEGKKEQEQQQQLNANALNGNKDSAFICRVPNSNDEIVYPASGLAEPVRRAVFEEAAKGRCKGIKLGALTQ